SLSIIAGLQDAGAQIVAYDPEGMEQARPLLQDVTYADSPYSAATGADILVLVTEWSAFRALDLQRVKQSMTSPVLVDLRNVYRADEAVRRDFTYVSIG
ncbi:UDP binding domain-containing protein, partial [Methylobacterium sp. R2-1]|uniref:UDP binding domain-containing protein n=1 Tax=Methylobacterium sp. R2-1 TaxID=2587064 RepID=UPI00180BDFAE